MSLPATPQPPNTTDPLPANHLATARKELAKLPLLGPALWLYGRDPFKRFTFVADIDWRLLPPLVMDQCRLYDRDGIPWAFFTWAMVTDEVDQRLRSSHPTLAPHEWHGGNHPWLIDMVMPFGDEPALVGELCKSVFGARPVMAWVPTGAGTASLRTLNNV